MVDGETIETKISDKKDEFEEKTDETGKKSVSTREIIDYLAGLGIDAVPRTIPLCILSIVLVPQAFFGGSSGIAGKSELVSVSAFNEIATPGAIIQPLKLRFSSTAQIFVAVPKSTINAGSGYSLTVPTAPAAKSAPS